MCLGKNFDVSNYLYEEWQLFSGSGSKNQFFFLQAREYNSIDPKFFTWHCYCVGNVVFRLSLTLQLVSANSIISG